MLAAPVRTHHERTKVPDAKVRMRMPVLSFGDVHGLQTFRLEFNMNL